MNIFIASAYAAEAGGSAPGAGMMNLIFLGGFILIFYFMLWRPQSKRRKEHMQLINSLEKGDEVVTSGGIVGQIKKVEADFVKIRISEEIDMRVQKNSIGATLPKGTLKSLDEA
tara:strand:- start:129 stop:470 length:342 start_codon:yes stop_codon:yes gene_type:complete